MPRICYHLDMSNSSDNMVPVVGRTNDGKTVWYTGRAGAAFVSPNAADAFVGYSPEHARVRAALLNAGTPLHGIHFYAGDLAKEVC